MKNSLAILALVSLTACGGPPIGMTMTDAGTGYGDAGPDRPEPDAGTPPDTTGCEPGTIRTEECYDPTCPAGIGTFFACLENRTWQCIVHDRSLCTPASAPDAGTPAPDAGGSCATTERLLRDADGDGYGNPSDYIVHPVCDPHPAGYVNWITGRDDCNDSDASVHPMAAEICGNAVDEDCNGLADVCPSTPPACASDPRVTTPTACIISATATSCLMTGIYVCNPDGRVICRGDIRVSSTEICGDGLDQDCNGMDIACSSSCTPRSEICGNGIDEDCDGVDRACTPACTPFAEICGNGIDEDCNGSDLACPTSTGTAARVVFEFRVSNTPTNYGTVSDVHLRADDLSDLTCLNTGSSDMLPLGDGWNRCVLSITDSLVFVARFRSTAISAGDLLHSTSDWTPSGAGSCYELNGMQWRVYREDTGLSLLASSTPALVRGASGGCRESVTVR